MTIVNLELPDLLLDLLPDSHNDTAMTHIPLQASNWQQLVNEMNGLSSQLASRLVDDADCLSKGIAVAINDELYDYRQFNKLVVEGLSFNEGDVLSVIIPFSGG